MVRGVPVTMEWMTCGAYSVALRLQRQGLAGRQRPPGLLVLRDVLLADAEVDVDRDAQPLDLALVVQVPRHVLRGVLAGLGRVVAQPAVHVDPHPPAQLLVGRDPRVQQRVEVLAVVLASRSSHAWWLTPAAR